MAFRQIILLILETFIIFSLCEEVPADLTDLIVKGIGNDEINVTKFGLNNTEFVYYDLDLYPNQYIQIDLSKSKDNIQKIEPLTEKKYYTTVTNPLSPETTLKRDTKNIEDVGSIEVEVDDTDYKIYYDDFKIPDTIVKMYFDFVDKKNHIVSTIQINVMPELENIDGEEIIEFGEEPYDKFKNAVYLKEVRHGSLLEMYCKNVNPDHESPTHGFKKNVVSKILYEHVDSLYFSVYEPHTENFVLDLRNDVIYSMNDVKKVTCVEGNFKNIYLKKFEYDKFSGYNIEMVPSSVKNNEREKYFDIKDENVVSIDVPRYHLYPMDCFKDFIDPFFNIIRIKDYYKGSKLTNISKSIKILDTSRVSSYNTISLGCKYEGTSNAPDVYFHTKPSCDLTNTDNLAKDKISCTMFLNPSNKEVFIYKNKDLKLREEKLGYNTYYL